MHLTKTKIEQTERTQRTNLINSISGSKPAMLLATKSVDGRTNLGLFSNVIHLGADPAMIGVLFRPQHDNPRDTYVNIKETGFYTLNHVPAGYTERAHFTSARFPPESSEFEACGFTEEYTEDFYAPYVKESAIKIGLKFLEEIPVTLNNTILVIGEIQHLFVPDECVDELGHIDIAAAGSVAASGLNTYYQLIKTGSYPYAKVRDLPDFGSELCSKTDQSSDN